MKVISFQSPVLQRAVSHQTHRRGASGYFPGSCLFAHGDPRHSISKLPKAPLLLVAESLFCFSQASCRKRGGCLGKAAVPAPRLPGGARSRPSTCAGPAAPGGGGAGRRGERLPSGPWACSVRRGALRGLPRQRGWNRGRMVWSQPRWARVQTLSF